MYLAAAKGSASNMMKSCFVAGTKLWTPDGYRNIEEIQPGDYVFSRYEFNPTGPIEEKLVEETFALVGRIFHLHVEDRVIRTTSEHPFFAEGKGWTNAGELQIGDRVLGAKGEWLKITDLLDTGEFEPVYNMRVADYHRYFIGDDGWLWNIWSHNSDVCTVLRGYTTQYFRAGSKVFRLDSKGLRHILERHHPQFYKPALANSKKVTSFLSQNETVQGILSKIRTIIDKNQAQISSESRSLFNINDNVGNETFQLGFNGGRIGQFLRF
jgi:hypothetical protein